MKKELFAERYTFIIVRMYSLILRHLCRYYTHSHINTAGFSLQIFILLFLSVLPVAFAQFIEPLPPGEGAIGGPGIQPGEPVPAPSSWPTAEWCDQAANCLSCQYKSGCYWNGFACAIGRITYSCPTAGGGGGGSASWDFSLTSNSYTKTFGQGETGAWTPTLRLQRLRGFGKTTVLRVELAGGPRPNAPVAVFSGTGADTFTQTFDPTKLSIFDIPLEISVSDAAPGTYRFRVVAEGADVTKDLTLTVLVEASTAAPVIKPTCSFVCADNKAATKGFRCFDGSIVTDSAQCPQPSGGAIPLSIRQISTPAPPVEVWICPDENKLADYLCKCPDGTIVGSADSRCPTLPEKASTPIVQPVEPFDFSITLSPDSATVTSGGSISYNVRVSSLKGTPQKVNLKAWLCELTAGQYICSSGWGPDHPSGIFLSLDPISGIPPFTSTLTFSLEKYAERHGGEYFSGTLDFRVDGTSKTKIKQSNYVSLVVEKPTPVPTAQAPTPTPTTTQSLLCDTTSQAIVNAIGGCSQIDPATYPNIYSACCKEVTKETLLGQLDSALADGVIEENEKSGLLYALNAYLS